MPVNWDSLVIGPCNGVFGEAVRYSPASGAASFAISGVFDEAYIEVTPMGAGPFQSTELSALGAPGGITSDAPVLGVQLSQFAVPPIQGDSLTVQSIGQAFVVKEVQPDGHGWALLLLNLAP